MWKTKGFYIFQQWGHLCTSLVLEVCFVCCKPMHEVKLEIVLEWIAWWHGGSQTVSVLSYLNRCVGCFECSYLLEKWTFSDFSEFQCEYSGRKDNLAISGVVWIMLHMWLCKGSLDQASYYSNRQRLRAQHLVFCRIKMGHENIGQSRLPAPAPFTLTADEHNDEVKD